MNEPTEIDMAETRLRISSSPTYYLEAVANHHSRVARLAIDMRKMVDASQFSSEPPIDHMEQMARIIENSFARAFGVKLRAVPMSETNEVKPDGV